MNPAMPITAYQAICHLSVYLVAATGHFVTRLIKYFCRDYLFNAEMRKDRLFCDRRKAAEDHRQNKKTMINVTKNIVFAPKNSSLPRRSVLCDEEAFFATKNRSLRQRSVLCDEEAFFATKKRSLRQRSVLCDKEAFFATKKRSLRRSNVLCDQDYSPSRRDHALWAKDHPLKA